ncbi:MAG: transporter substrate-binding domain-containing protein [Deltaproteobacteria bacterium]|nr:transporter substrate-binding domain-containing protein [Deltaproteobacteria bacterium]
MMEAEGRYTGFDSELWEQIAKELKLEFNYRLTDKWRITSDLVEGKADIAFSCMPITREWEETIDFSHPYLESGLRILILNKSTFSMKQTLKSIFSPLFFKILGALFVFIFICGNAVWYVEKGGRIISGRYFTGILEAFWYVLVTMTTVGYGDVVPRKWFGRLIALFIMFIGIGFFGWVIAQFSSVITVQRLHADIESSQELQNRVVATVEFTPSVRRLNKLGAIVVPVAKIDEAYELLLKEKVDAVVFDSPSILYYERYEGAGKVKAVGLPFGIQYYGFMFPEGSELRELVNRTLLKLKENGTYDGIYEKWFGKVDR